MSQHHLATSTPSSSSSSFSGAPGLVVAAGLASATQSSSLDIDQQRRLLQGQVEALRQAGALPSAAAAGQPGSAVQWTNWSNG
jgi:hypothetical protein